MMPYIITKTVASKFVYYYPKNFFKDRYVSGDWNGLRSNAKVFESFLQMNDILSDLKKRNVNGVFGYIDV